MAVDYQIVTYCSENYQDAHDFSIESWRKFCNDIYVYSDTDKFGIQIFDKNKDWYINVERKVHAIEYHLKNNAKEHFAWLDCDCLIMEDIGDAFRGYDVSLTRMINRTNRGHGMGQAGVIFFRNTPGTLILLKEWKDLMFQYKKLYERKKMNRLYEQTALSHLVLDAFDGLKEYSAAILSEKKYNSENDKPLEWLKDIKKYKPKILHFKAGAYRDKVLVDKALKLAEKN